MLQEQLRIKSNENNTIVDQNNKLSLKNEALQQQIRNLQSDSHQRNTEFLQLEEVSNHILIIDKAHLI
jgi:cell division protein FtsB